MVPFWEEARHSAGQRQPGNADREDQGTQEVANRFILALATPMESKLLVNLKLDPMEPYQQTTAGEQWVGNRVESALLGVSGNCSSRHFSILATKYSQISRNSCSI